MNTEHLRPHFEELAYQRYLDLTLLAGSEGDTVEVMSKEAVFARNPDGTYFVLSMNSAWWGYQAGAGADPAAVQVVVPPLDNAPGGESGVIFPDISEEARAGSTVAMRKIFLATGGDAARVEEMHAALSKGALSAPPRGFVLVPVEPTDAMTYAGQQARYPVSNSITVIYKAMLDAAPAETPPEAGAAQAVTPMFFASAEQANALQDRPDDNVGGVYLPLRKTAAGKFTMPLYAATPAAEAST
jgi:hypothetical protein